MWWNITAIGAIVTMMFCPFQIAFQNEPGAFNNSAGSILFHFYEAGIKVEYKSIYLPTLPPDDRYIMDLIATTPYGRNPQKIYAINWCRTYLQVNRVAELLVADGTEIHEDVWACDRLRHDISLDQYQWARNCEPSSYAKRVWREMLTECLKVNPHNTDRRVKPWMQPTQETMGDLSWNYRYHHDEDRIYHRQPDESWIAYYHLPQRNRRHSRYAVQDTRTELPQNTVPATAILLANDQLVLRSTGQSRRLPQHGEDATEEATWFDLIGPILACGWDCRNHNTTRYLCIHSFYR